MLKGYSLAEVPENPELRQELTALDSQQLFARLTALRPTLHNTTDTLDRERLIRAIEIAEGRITSYNVCYTKLLRAKN